MNRSNIVFADNDEKTALHIAAQMGDSGVVEHLLENNVNVDVKGEEDDS